MKLSAGYPFSLVKNGLPFDYPKLEKNIRTGVLVMGGGISGALTAHYLIHAGIDCTLVDARSIGLGSTCASTSLLQYEIDTPLHRLIDLSGKKNAVTAYRLCAEAIRKLESLSIQTGMTDFNYIKSLYYAAYKKDISFIKHTTRDVQLKTRDGYTIRARKLVYATGYEVVNFISQPIVTLHSTYATISESFSSPQQFGKTDALLWSTADPYLYMRTTADNRILIGGRDEKFFSPAKRDKLIKTKARQLKNDFRKLFPGIPLQTEFSWTGTFGTTRDGLPYIGPYKKLANSFFSLGFGGNGITFSSIAATIIKDLLAGKKNSDADIFKFDR